MWLGRRDSNPRMLGPEPSALPLGDSPINCRYVRLSDRQAIEFCQIYDFTEFIIERSTQ